MQHRKTDFERLVAELEADALDLHGLVVENSRALARIQLGANDSLDWAALGYTIHNIYGVIENYCLRIAKFFENGIAQDRWHKELLRRMTLSIGDLRPALLDNEALFLIDELRSFRQLFRNLYARPLDPERMRHVQAKVKPATEAFLKAHEAYILKLATIAMNL
jgi:hypothetical protein